MAVVKGHLEVVKLLITQGADVNAVSGPYSSGWGTPLKIAIYNGHEDIAELLRQHGGHE